MERVRTLIGRQFQVSCSIARRGGRGATRCRSR
ncbi:hypothetical protein [Streptomyces avermitilis]